DRRMWRQSGIVSNDGRNIFCRRQVVIKYPVESEKMISAHRGAPENPGNRFEKLHLERDEDWNPDDDPSPRTQFLIDHSKTAIAYNDSPDIGFGASLNPYRGCE